MNVRKGKRAYVDMSYEITKDTLEDRSSTPCSMDMDKEEDKCLYRGFAEELIKTVELQ